MNLTKEKILSASAELFNAKGYDGCSLLDIMEATGLKKGGIYNYFKNKDEIALEAFDFSLNLLISKFRERLDKDKTSKDKLISVLDVLAGLGDGSTLKGGCPVFNTAVYSSNHLALKLKARGGLEMLKSYIVIKIEEGKINCEFKDDADSEKIASLLIMTMEGSIIMARLYDDICHIEIAKDYLKHYFEKYLFI